MGRTLFIIFGFLLMVTAIPTKAADLVIVASSAPGLAEGQIIQHDTLLKIPSGASITVIAQNGQSATIVGPHSGLAAIDAGNGDPGGLVSSLSALLGGSGTETTSIGVMRAVPLAPPEDPWVIDTSRSGDHCVPASGPVMMWRAKGTITETLVIKKMDAARSKAQIDWPQGEATLAWPDSVPLAEGGVYLVRTKDGKTARKIVLHLVPDELPTDAHQAAWMADKGCTRQARTLVSKIR